MTRRTVLIIVAIASWFNSGNGQPPAVKIDWSAKPIKGSFERDEPIMMSYRLSNNSKSDVWVPKSVDPYISILLRFTDPDGRSMRWNGARFTFKYDSSDLILLKPGQDTSGTFQVPAACPNERRMEKGGFCFTKKGAYTGTAAFRLGLNAFYHREEIRGPVAEGPYLSDKFTFTVQ